MSTIKQYLNKKTLLTGLLVSGLFVVLQFKSVYSEENANNDIKAEVRLENDKRTDNSPLGVFSSDSKGNGESENTSLKDNGSTSVKSEFNQSQDSKNNSSVNIKLEHSNSSSGSNQNGSQAIEIDNQSIQINDSTIDIPVNGRIRETIKDENSTTRIRADIDSEGSSSIDISTNNKSN